MKRWSIILVFCMSVLTAWAQRDTVFWVAVPTLAEHSSDASLRLYLFSETEPASVKVSMPADSSFAPLYLDVIPGTHTDVLLAADYRDFLARIAAPSGVISNRALLIQATAPITCYCQLTGVNGEAFVPRGTIALGQEFVVAMQNRYPSAEIETSVYKDAYSSVQVVATEDATEVHVGNRVVQLQRGQVYSYQSSDKSAAAHLTGLKVCSNRPVSVYSSDDSPTPHPGISGEDAVLDQMLPVSAAGRDFIAVGRGLSWEGCFVQSVGDTVAVDYGVGGQCLLLPYQTQFLPLGKQCASMRIHGSAPMQAFQISGYWNEMGGVLLPDIYRSGSQRVQYRRMADSRHTSLNVIMPAADTASFNLSCMWQPVWGDSAWSYAVVDVSDTSVDSLITMETRTGAFHVGIVDATSAYADVERPVMTSASYSYFSSYGSPLIPSLLVPNEQISDTLPVIPRVTGDSTPTKQHVPVRHHLSVYGEGGYSHLPLMVDEVHFSRGYAVCVCVVYELVRKHFLFQTGAGLFWQDARHRMDGLQFVREDNDTQHAVNRVGYIIERSDRARTMSVEFPVLVGGTWRAFYMLGGVKLGVPVWGETRMMSISTTMAQYDQYYDVFSDMANHGLRTQVYSEQRGARLSYPVDLRMSFELGVRMGSRVRLAMFGDFGALLPAVTKTGAPLIDVDNHYDMQYWPMTHVVCSELATRETHTFTAGIRLTYRIL